MTGNGIVWEEPRNASADRTPWADRLAPLMERPGDWARVHEMPDRSASATVGHLKKRRHIIPPGRWEFTSRKTGPKSPTAYVYARYLGPDEDDGS